MLILMVELKVCRWRASARGSGERSEPAAGRPRKEQAPKAPSRIASVTYFKIFGPKVRRRLQNFAMWCFNTIVVLSNHYSCFISQAF